MTDQTKSEELFMQELRGEFIQKTISELAILQRHYQNNAYPEIAAIAHDIKGVAGLFKLDLGTELGKAMQTAAENQDHAQVGQLIERLSAYFKGLELAP
jgi:HPt (histidine-containing phosphotransfer) domain-containing protein